MGKLAGLEMDVAVARALGLDVLGVIGVFPNPVCEGRFIIGFKVGGNVPRPIYLDDCICEFREPNDRDYFCHHAGCLKVVRQYSTDIAAAWDLIDVMGSEGLILYPLDVSSDNLDETWCARFVTGDEPEVQPWEAGWSGRGDSAAVAICRAFLKAKQRAL